MVCLHPVVRSPMIAPSLKNNTSVTECCTINYFNQFGCKKQHWESSDECAHTERPPRLPQTLKPVAMVFRMRPMATRWMPTSAQSLTPLRSRLVTKWPHSFFSCSLISFCFLCPPPLPLSPYTSRYIQGVCKECVHRWMPMPSKTAALALISNSILEREGQREEGKKIVLRLSALLGTQGQLHPGARSTVRKTWLTLQNGILYICVHTKTSVQLMNKSMINNAVSNEQ
jgi:hypothetical protein